MLCHVLALALLSSQPAPPGFDPLQKKWDAAWKMEQGKRDETLRGINKILLDWVAKDKIKTGEQFRRASTLLADWNYKLPEAQIRYEWNLTALALGSNKAQEKVAELWDALMMATGRYRRFGAVQVDFENTEGQKYFVDKAPQVILDAIKSPTEFKRMHPGATRNSELKKIVDDDQAARGKPWNINDFSAMKKIMEEDRKRFARVKAIVAEGTLSVGEDFANAALVCQHGGVFADFMLAHELALSAFLLGDKGSMWLCGASYDRMLRSASYPQRFGTQLTETGVEEYSTIGINDRIRKSVIGKTLAESKALAKKVFRSIIRKT